MLYKEESYMNKKAQGISINVIIIAAIGLAVLVVLFAIFTGRLNIFSTGISKTASCENACKAQGKAAISGGMDETSCKANAAFNYVPGKYDDVAQGNACCCQ